jgi:hypothetical protein
MTSIGIDKTKYILLSGKEYYALQKQAALKTETENVFTLEEARAYSRKLINKWTPKKS